MINRKTSLRMIPLLLAASAALLAAGCGGSAPRRGDAVASVGGPRPQWAAGDSADFPRARYITGVGNADDETTAAERARAEVAGAGLGSGSRRRHRTERSTGCAERGDAPSADQGPGKGPVSSSRQNSFLR